MSVWADMILPETAKSLARYEHPFFGNYPAITRNEFGKGTVTYEGTILSDALQEKVVRFVLEQARVELADARVPPAVRVRQALSRDGRVVRFYLNFSGSPQSFAYQHRASTDLLTGEPVADGANVSLGPWDLAVIREPR